MANELMTDGQSKTESSDAFAFAMLMVEVRPLVLHALMHMCSRVFTQTLTGAPPFTELQNEVAVINAIVSGKRPPSPFAAESHAAPTCAEQRLWRLMQICWHSKPRARPSLAAVKGCLRMITTDTASPPLRSTGSGVSISPVIIISSDCVKDSFFRFYRRYPRLCDGLSCRTRSLLRTAVCITVLQ